jgi:hypothetical protein
MAKESINNREFLEYVNNYELLTGEVVRIRGLEFGCFRLYFSSFDIFEEFTGNTFLL